MALWWKQLESEDPRRFKMLQRNGQVGPGASIQTYPEQTNTICIFMCVYIYIYIYVCMYVCVCVCVL